MIVKVTEDYGRFTEGIVWRLETKSQDQEVSFTFFIHSF